MVKTSKSTAKAPPWPDSAFWAFSIDLYERPGVEAACLALQDRRGVNVNLLLWALWLAECGVVLDQEALERGRAAIESWQALVIMPLRQIRRELRRHIESANAENIGGKWPHHVDTLRQKILTLELDSEHLAQLALGRLGDELKPSRRASAKLAGDNLACLGMLESGDRGDLANLLKQVFPDAHQTRLDAVLDGVFTEA